MGRRITTNAGVCKADVINLLLDREWHTLPELTQALADCINPEEAARAYVTATGGAKRGGPDRQTMIERRRLAPMEIRVASGKMRIVYALTYGEDFEVSESTDPLTFMGVRTVRLVLWHCWSCGKKQNEASDKADQERRLCVKCAALVKEDCGDPEDSSADATDAETETPDV